MIQLGPLAKLMQKGEGATPAESCLGYAILGCAILVSSRAKIDGWWVHTAGCRWLTIRLLACGAKATGAWCRHGAA